MNSLTKLVVTSISEPNTILKKLAEGAKLAGWEFILIGDTKSPKYFHLESSRFYDIEAQLLTGLEYASLCPTKHYARKNIGYLIAISEGAESIVETDDDNIPLDSFWELGSLEVQGKAIDKIDEPDWVNIYKYFSDSIIWPRGFPLDKVNNCVQPPQELDELLSVCPIQQGLADRNPDVDAIFRLILPLPQVFKANIKLSLGKGSWCPFNSQNTVWFPPAYPLLYLPAYCSFRMTDIWRSFVAQRICWENGWRTLFYSPTVYQERNVHNLMKDFEDEIPGYLNNEKICESLSNINLQSGELNIPDNLRKCYEVLIGLGVVRSEESKLLEAWIGDLNSIGQ